MKSFRQFCKETYIVPTVFQCSLTELLEEITDLKIYFDRVIVTVDEGAPLTVSLRFQECEEIGKEGDR